MKKIIMLLTMVAFLGACGTSSASKEEAEKTTGETEAATEEAAASTEPTGEPVVSDPTIEDSLANQANEAEQVVEESTEEPAEQ